MKIKATKIVTVVILALSLIFSMNVVAFASTPEADAAIQIPVVPDMVDSVAMSFNSISSTQAVAKVIASSSGDTPYITSKITLQSSSNGGSTWTNVTSNTKTVYDIAIFHTAYFTISQSLDYRIKVQLTDEVNGITITTTWYHNLD